MTLNKTSYRRKINFYGWVVFLLALLGILVVEVQRSSWAGGTRLFCVFYAAVVTVFLIAQIVAFVVGHATYSEAVEQPKYDLIENEEKEWEGYHATHS